MWNCQLSSPLCLNQVLPFKRLIQMIAFSLYGLFCSILHGDKSSVPLNERSTDWLLRRWLPVPTFTYFRFTLYTLFSDLCNRFNGLLRVCWFANWLDRLWSPLNTGINVFKHFHWNDSQVQPVMVFLCVCPKDMNLQGNGKTCKVPQIVPRGKCFLEAL